MPQHSYRPLSAITPTLAADQAGADYVASVSSAHRKEHGLYLTPVEVASFMAAQLSPPNTKSALRILDPAAGAGVLLCAAVEAMAIDPRGPRHIEVVAYELDPVLATTLTRVLDNLVVWSAARGTAVKVTVVQGDFVLAHAPALHSVEGLFAHLEPSQAFDVIIANPPYFKLNKADPRAAAAAAVVHGQPNIYGLFMAIGAALLRPQGTFVFITPRSFAAGPYFRLFRERFFTCIRPRLVHVFGSRRDAFSRDAVLQENVVLIGTRQDHWHRHKVSHLMAISESAGIDDLGSTSARSVRLADVLDMSTKDKILRLPVSIDDEALVRLVDSWPSTLGSLGLRISTGPVVPFRARHIIDQAGNVPGSHAPLLWMNHVKPMQVTWPLGRHKPEYIKTDVVAAPVLVPNRNYVLLRRFSAKEEARRLVAAPYIASIHPGDMLGLENHLNYIYRPAGLLSEHEVLGLAAIFSSALLDRYFRVSNGNTQVSATELRAMPLPDLATIISIGKAVATKAHDADAIDALVMTHTQNADKIEKVAVRG